MTATAGCFDAAHLREMAGCVFVETAIDVPLQRTATEHLRSLVLAVGSAVSTQRDLQFVVIDVAFAEHQYPWLLRNLVSTGLVPLFDLEHFPGIVALIAPDAGAALVDGAIKRDFLLRRQMLLPGNHQHLVVVQCQPNGVH